MTAVAAKQPPGDDVATDQKGSVPAVQQGITVARHDAAVHEAGNGHEKSFARC